MNITKTSIIQERFPHRFCVNLDRRPERWMSVSQEFRKHGIGVTRFSAYDALEMDIPADWRGRPGAYGCLSSHLEIVRKARDRGYANVLIFEDDVVFDAELEARLPGILAELPDDWDMFFLGGCHREAPIRVTPNIFRMTRTYATHAYVLNHTVYESFIHQNSTYGKPVDMNNGDLQQTHACYCAIPHLAWQQEGWSDIQMEQESHWAMRESLILAGDDIEAVLADTTVVLAYRKKGDGLLSKQNLEHVVAFYHKEWPNIEILVTADERELAAHEAPPHCRFIGLAQPKRDQPKRDLMFRQGFKHAQRSFFIFSDASVRPSLERYVRPNLLKCREHGGATFFDTLIQLNETDSALVRDGRHNLVDMTTYAPEPVVAAEVGAFMLTRQTLEQMEDNPITDLATLPLFRPPNRGLMLN